MSLSQVEFNKALLHLVQRLAKEVRRATKNKNQQITLLETQQQLQDLEAQLPQDQP